MGITTTYLRSFNTKKLDPYTPFHRLVQWNMRNIPLARRFAVWGDELFGYDQSRLDHKWWLDLEDVEGTLKVPSYAGDRGHNKGTG